MMTVSLYFGREKHEPLVDASSQKMADKVSFAQCVSLKSTHVRCDWSRGPELQSRECEASACSTSVSHSFIQPWCRNIPKSHLALYISLKKSKASLNGLPSASVEWQCLWKADCHASGMTRYGVSQDGVVGILRHLFPHVCISALHGPEHSLRCEC